MANKKIISFLLVLVLVLGMATTAFAEEPITTLDRANALNELGLFAGTDKGFDLENMPNRTQAIIFLLRMLGDEKLAQESSYVSPFTDVPYWASGYISYAYAKGYTSGISKTEFGTNNIATPEQFITFMLRALGYSDKAGEFTLPTAIQKAETLKIVPTNKYQVGAKTFNRGDCVDIIYNMLTACRKGDTKTLAKTLIEKGALDIKIAEKYGFSEPTQKYQMVRVPIISEKNGKYTLVTRDVLNSIPKAVSVVYKWGDESFVNDYSAAYDVDAYEELKSPNNFYKNVNINRTVNPPEVNDKTMYYVSVCDENANMIAASICTVGEAIERGSLEFALVFINGEEIMSKFNEDFNKAFGNPTEKKDAIIAIEKARFNKTVISKKTGEVVHQIPYDSPESLTEYRYVINEAKYPELAKQTKYFQDGLIPSGEAVLDTIKNECLFIFKYASNFNGSFGGGTPTSVFTDYSGKWTNNATEWNKARYVVFADDDKILGYTSIVPSQLEIVDLGIIDKTIYVD